MPRNANYLTLILFVILDEAGSVSDILFSKTTTKNIPVRWQNLLKLFPLASEWMIKTWSFSTPMSRSGHNPLTLPSLKVNEKCILMRGWLQLRVKDFHGRIPTEEQLAESQSHFRGKRHLFSLQIQGTFKTECCANGNSLDFFDFRYSSHPNSHHRFPLRS